LPLLVLTPPSVTPWNMYTLSPMMVVSPMTTPTAWSMKRPLPIVAPGCMSAPVRNRAK